MLFAFVFLLTCFLALSFNCSGSTAELRPGDVVGPHNWRKVKDMVGDNLLKRIKQGYTFEIKETYHYDQLEEYLEATRKHSRKVKLGIDGALLNYVAGIPFPDVDPADPRVGVKLAWNFYWRWLGDDFKDGGGTRQEKVIRHAIERDGSERRGAVVNHVLRTRGRVTLNPRPFIPGYGHIDWMLLRADEYPRDTSGTTTLEIRYSDPNVADDLYVYVPSIRRVRRVPPIQRCSTLAPTEFNWDDINSFNGKLTNFNYRFLGEKKMLSNLAQEHRPVRRKRGDYLPLDEEWEVRDTYALEISPKSSDYCYPKKVIYIDKMIGEVIWVMIWDRDGNYWKEQFSFRTPVRLPDGRIVWSGETVVMVNVKNGRATVLTNTRRYNQGYKPSLFSLATLQKVLRGGSIP